MWVYQVTAMETLSLSWAIVLPTYSSITSCAGYLCRGWFATFSQEKPILFMAETTPHV